MIRTSRQVVAGFTLVELLIGSTLAAAVLAAVLSSYLYLGRNLARLANQQTLETEARRTLGQLAQDVQQATGIDNTGISPKVSLSATGLTLSMPATTTGGANYVIYSYDSSAGTLSRQVRTNAAVILVRNISANSLVFRYYDAAGREYTTYTNYLPGIKQVSLEFSTQNGVSTNGTRTLVYSVASDRLLLRNRALLQ